MEEFVADFIIEDVEPIQTTFEINVNSNEWGSIKGDIDNQRDLLNALNGKANVSDVESITGALDDSIIAVDNKYDSITGGLDDSITALDSIVSDNFTTLSDSITNNYNTLDSLIGGVDDKIDNHIADTANPHSVTKTQVGLGNVDNTSDLEKPVSTAQQTVLDNKVTKNADITAATKCKITYDAKGLVTAGADLQQSDIPALNLTKISDVTATYTEVNQLHESGVVKADFEKLHAVTADAAELNILDGVTASTNEINTLDGLTASTAELNILDGATVTTTELNYVDGVTSNIQTQFDNITDVIPSAASETNQLADKNFVNSSIATNTANFIGTFNSVADLEAYSGTLTNNDYAFVITTDALGNTAYYRYKYTTATTPASLIFEYELNNSSFTSDQWAAINSLITSDTKVTHTANTAVGNSTTPVYIDASGNATALSCTLATSVPVGAVFTDTTYTITTGTANGTIAVSVNGGAASDVSVKGLGSAAYTASTNYATSAQGAKADSAVQSVTTGSANGTISVDGTDVSVYGLDSAAYTASSAYATSSQGSKADSAIQSVKVNGTALTPDANKAVDVTVPTNISAFTNDSGYITSSALSGYIKSDSGNSSQTIQSSSGGGTTPVIFKSNSSSSCYLSYYAGSTWVGSIGVNSSKKPVFYNGSSYTLAYTSDIPTTASDISAADTDLSNLSATGEAHFQTPLGYTAENASNKITSLSSSSTDTQYPSAKCVYDLIGDVETLLSQV